MSFRLHGLLVSGTLAGFVFPLACSGGQSFDDSGDPLSLGTVRGELPPLPGSSLQSAAGQACVPSDQESAEFSGYSADEVSVDADNSVCNMGVCLAQNFQGRVGCPDGQSAGDGACLTPGGDPVVVGVKPQRADRSETQAVFCSCRCDGPDPDANYCSCDASMKCEPLIADLGAGDDSLVGSYCVPLR